MIADAPALRGAVATPPALAAWVAELLAAELPAGPVAVADLACGRGALLEAVRAVRPDAALTGVEVDEGDADAARAALPDARIEHGDALGLLGTRPLGHLDGVVLNPPWGAAPGRTPAELRALGYTLARGHFDSAALFVELALDALAPGGAGAFVLPDSVFFPDHAAFRRLLLARAEVVVAARLGEGFFAGVARGTAVLVVRNRPPARGHEVACLRLRPAERRDVLAGRRTLAAIHAERAHPVAQERFAADATLDIAVRDELLPLVARMRERGADWARRFDTGRGVELSRTGRVVRCPACGRAWPLPRRPRTLTCAACGTTAPSAALPVEVIVRPPAGDDPAWVPLIAGVDVRRYAAAPGREIRTGVPGIDYKTGRVPEGERLLVRKTGVGLRTAVTDVPALTTQVVFHYAPRPGAPAWATWFAQGVLASRAMLAFHLLRSGEDEWRSHPYVTQRVLAALPVPDPDDGDGSAIARAARALAADQEDRAADLALERLVARLYGLGPAELGTVATVLDDAQRLEGIAELRFAPGDL